ncbi:MAG: STAS domain-containing protein [Actinobacteria bacterium]|nr:STAS domain-containing protein [Actinomycetota bacterium]
MPMLAQIEERFEGPLTIERTRYGDNVVVLSLAGELDLAAAPAVWDALEPVLQEPSAILVLDLSELELIDSSGIALLYRLAEARTDRESLRLLPSRHAGVNKVLKLTDVSTIITIVAP